jgi:hypothetical protein
LNEIDIRYKMNRHIDIRIKEKNLRKYAGFFNIEEERE